MFSVAPSQRAQAMRSDACDALMSERGKRPVFLALDLELCQWYGSWLHMREWTRRSITCARVNGQVSM